MFAAHFTYICAGVLPSSPSSNSSAYGNGRVVVIGYSPLPHELADRVNPETTDGGGSGSGSGSGTSTTPTSGGFGGFGRGGIRITTLTAESLRCVRMTELYEYALVRQSTRLK
jgi:hypothetical protein